MFKYLDAVTMYLDRNSTHTELRQAANAMMDPPGSQNRTTNPPTICLGGFTTRSSS